MSRCPGLDTLELGGPKVDSHLRRCDPCRAIRDLMAIESDEEPSPSTQPLAEEHPASDADCARAELLIAAGAGTALSDADAAFLPAHLARCPGCRKAALEPPAADGEELQLPLVSPDNYVVGAEIGRGGMGRIVAARDRRTGRTVALKEMLATKPGARERFEREARITARLQHPGIVSIYEVGQWPDGRPFYAMPILTGRTLAAALARAADLRQRLQLLPALIAAADAIAYAHSRGIIHRDLTPANILLGSFGETVVIDWGVARDLDGDGDPEAGERQPDLAATRQEVRAGRGGLTVAGTVVGTPAYMAPEQADGQPVDQRADVYSLGAILHHLLLGRPPYHGHGSQTVITLLRARAAAAGAVPERAPRDLASVARRAMETSPARRYDSAAGFVEELRRFVAGQRVQAHGYSWLELGRRWLSRRMVPVAATALVLAVVASGALVGGLKVARERNRAETTATALLAEQGRQELLAGAPSRALVYLQEAHRRGDTSPALRLLLASALRSIEARGPSFQLPAFPDQLAFSPDGRYLATALIGAVVGVSIWDMRQERQVQLITDARFPFGHLRFSGDGALLATWGQAAPVDTGIALWDTRTWKVVRVVAAGRSVTDVQLSADGPLLLATADDETGVELYETGSGRRQQVVKPRFTNNRLRGRLLTDGRRFITFGDREPPTVRDLKTGRVLRTLALGHTGIQSLDVRADGQRLLIAGTQGAQLWDLATGRAVVDLGGLGLVHSARFSGDGARVLMIGQDDHALLFDADSGHLVASLGRGEPEIRGFLPEFSKDGLRLVTVAPNGVRSWLAHTGTLLESYDETGPIAALAISPDGRWLATATYDREVQLRDLTRSVLRESRPLPQRDNAPLPAGTPLAGARVLAMSADHRKVLVLPDADPPRPELRDASTLALELRLPARGNLRQVALTPDGRGVLTTEASGAVTLWLPGDRQIQFPGFQQALSSHAFSADGSRLYLQETGGQRAGLWDPRDGRLVARIEANQSSVPLFSPDGSLLVLWGEELAVWNASDGRFLYNVSEFLPLMGAGFSADSQHIYLLSSDLGVIDARTGRLLSRVNSPGGLTDAAFGHDSSLLLTVGRDSTEVFDWRTRRVLLRLAGDGVSDDRTAYWLSAMVAAWKGERPALLNINPDDRQVVLNRHQDRVYLWDLSLESRSARDIDRVIARHRVPWRLDGGQLVRVSTDARDPASPTAPEPRNLDFEQGAAGQPPADWRVEGQQFRASTIARPSASGRLAAQLVGRPLGLGEGSLMQTVDASAYRSQAVRLRAAVRCEPGLPVTLHIRARRPGSMGGLGNKLMGPALCDGQWRVVAVTGNVDADAVTLQFGVTLETDGEVALDDVSLQVLHRK